MSEQDAAGETWGRQDGGHARKTYWLTHPDKGVLGFRTEAEREIAYAELSRLNALEDRMQAAEQQLREAKAAIRESLRELNNLRENRCTCPHDYYHGDHHYMYCPAANEMKAATKRIWSGLNRPAYALERALTASPAPAEEESR